MRKRVLSDLQATRWSTLCCDFGTMRRADGAGCGGGDGKSQSHFLTSSYCGSMASILSAQMPTAARHSRLPEALIHNCLRPRHELHVL